MTEPISISRGNLRKNNIGKNQVRPPVVEHSHEEFQPIVGGSADVSISYHLPGGVASESSISYGPSISIPSSSSDPGGPPAPASSSVPPPLQETDLPQEIEEGNIEYKLKIVDPTPERFCQLVSQLKWRLMEGQGEAIYELGVEDDGTLRGLKEEDMEKSIQSLHRMCKELDAECSIVCKRKGREGQVAQMLVRRKSVSPDEIIGIRIAVCGNVDSGKSTLVGVLTSGKLDNGRGRARLNVFNHKHEIECGRTSSVSEQILGFNARGETVNSLPSSRSLSWSEIVADSTKLISFYDLAGHEKYLKTTISGMTGNQPDFCLLLVGANMGVTRMTREHLGLAVALRVPIIVVLTKIDMCPPNVLRQTIGQLTNLLKMRTVRKVPFGVKNAADVVTAVKNLQNDKFVPVFRLSSVTGAGIDLLRNFFNLLHPRISWVNLVNNPPEVLIDETYFITGVGTVVAGTVSGGVVHDNSKMLLGPDSNGNFKPVSIKSIHARRQPVKHVPAGQSAGFALKKIKRSTVHKGMALVHPSAKPVAIWGFEAKIVVLYHSTTIAVNYQPVIQCLTIRQSAKITHMEESVLRTGDKAIVRFRFLYHPVYLKHGMRMVFREGRCKGIGVVTKLFDAKDQVVTGCHQAEDPPPVGTPSRVILQSATAPISPTSASTDEAFESSLPSPSSLE